MPSLVVDGRLIKFLIVCIWDYYYFFRGGISLLTLPVKRAPFPLFTCNTDVEKLVMESLIYYDNNGATSTLMAARLILKFALLRRPYVRVDNYLLRETAERPGIHEFLTEVQVKVKVSSICC